MKENIEISDLQKFEKAFNERKENIALQPSLIAHGISESSFNYKQDINLKHIFSLDVKSHKVTNQERSGRCWMFATCNIMRYEVIKNLDVENMELSQTYPLFFDKLEKSNFFLENIISTVNEKVTSRTVSFLLTSPVQDGGQYDMFVSLVNKYGVCPKELMPETYSSRNTAELDKYLTTKLRQFASIIRKKSSQGANVESLRQLKNKMMTTIYQILALTLGVPPKVFSYEYVDKNKNYHIIKDITPLEFYKKYVGIDLSNKISIINAPTKDKPFNNTYTVKFLGNVVKGHPIKYLNLPINKIKELVIKQLKNDEAVWFGADVSQFGNREKGILSKDNFMLEEIFDTSFQMTKEERIDYGESKMNHAMVITGVNLVNNKPNRWKIENSWGEKTGKEGFYVMDDSWFDDFVYQVVIDKKYLTEELLLDYEKEPIELDPWDPFGSLAK